MGRTVSGASAVAQAVARRLITPAGALMFHPEYGYDIRGTLNDDATERTPFQIQTAIEAEALKDERVLSVDVETDFNARTGKTTVRLLGESAFGTFSLVLGVDDVTAEVLEYS